MERASRADDMGSGENPAMAPRLDSTGILGVSRLNEAELRELSRGAAATPAWLRRGQGRRGRPRHGRHPVGCGPRCPSAEGKSSDDGALPAAGSRVFSSRRSWCRSLGFVERYSDIIPDQPQPGAMGRRVAPRARVL